MKFENPGPSRRRAGRSAFRYLTEAAEAMARPGEWGILEERPVAAYRSANALAFQIREGRYAAFRPRGEWDTTIRRVDDTVRVYVRFKGEK